MIRNPGVRNVSLPLSFAESLDVDANPIDASLIGRLEKRAVTTEHGEQEIQRHTHPLFECAGNGVGAHGQNPVIRGVVRIGLVVEHHVRRCFMGRIP